MLYICGAENGAWNPLKSNVVHFRQKHVPLSSAIFRYGDYDITTVSSYKYLGVIFDEFLDYTKTATMLAESAGRALGSIYNKYKINRGFGYSTYTKLYESGVVPILDYCSSVCGYNVLDKIDTIQNRAIRQFLGVHRFAANRQLTLIWGGYHVEHDVILTCSDYGINWLLWMTVGLWKLYLNGTNNWNGAGAKMYMMYSVAWIVKILSLKTIALIWILFAQPYTNCIVTIGRIPLHVYLN